MSRFRAEEDGTGGYLIRDMEKDTVAGRVPKKSDAHRDAMEMARLFNEAYKPMPAVACSKCQQYQRVLEIIRERTDDRFAARLADDALNYGEWGESNGSV